MWILLTLVDLPMPFLLDAPYPGAGDQAPPDFYELHGHSGAGLAFRWPDADGDP